MMNIKNKLASVLARAFSSKAVPEGNVNKEAKASKKLENWLKSSRMRSF